MDKLKAVYDDELVSFLRNIGALKEIERGNVKCKFCDEVITLDNLLATFPVNKQIFFCCEKDACLIQMNKLGIG